MQYKNQEGDSVDVLTTSQGTSNNPIKSKLLIPESGSRGILAPGPGNSSTVQARPQLFNAMDAIQSQLLTPISE